MIHTTGQPKKTITDKEQVDRLKKLCLETKNIKLREQVKNSTIPVVGVSLPSKKEKWQKRVAISMLIASKKIIGGHPESKGVSNLTDEILDIIYNER